MAWIRSKIDNKFVLKYVTTLNSDDRNGPTAEFYESGTLKWFGVCRSGNRAGGWQLEIVDGQNEGRAFNLQGSGGTEDYEIYCDGHFEVYDAWSDNSGPEKMKFTNWVAKWLSSINSAWSSNDQRGKSSAKSFFLKRVK